MHPLLEARQFRPVEQITSGWRYPYHEHSIRKADEMDRVAGRERNPIHYLDSPAAARASGHPEACNAVLSQEPKAGSEESEYCKNDQ
jgi:hypothetical protein